MKLEYDPVSGAAYIQLRDAKIDTTEEIVPGVHVDFAEDGLPVGFEFLDAEKVFGETPRGVEFVVLGDFPRRKAG